MALADNVTIKVQMLMRRKGFPERVYRVVATDGDVTWLRPRDRSMDDEVLIHRAELDKQWEPYEPPLCDNWAAICRQANLFNESNIIFTMQGQHLYISSTHIARFYAHLTQAMTADERHQADDVLRMLRHA